MQASSRKSYTLGAGSLLLGVKKCVLDHAFLPLPEPSAPVSPLVALATSPLPAPSAGTEAFPSSETATSPQFGWVSRGLPLPPTGGAYAVEFIDKTHAYVLAYLDPYGRAFATDRPFSIPPAQEPDLTFAKDATYSKDGVVTGTVNVSVAPGAMREVARFRCEGNSYAFFDSWYNFGRYGVRLPYDDAMARAFIAFVYRPEQGAPAVPSVGLDDVFRCLDNTSFIVSCKSLQGLVRRSQPDPALRAPALATCLLRWLEDAGLNDVLALDPPDNAIRLVRTMRYAGTFYLALEEELDVPPSTIWALEGALNRFLLIYERLESRASRVDEETVCNLDEEIFETVAVQAPPERAVDVCEAGDYACEWNVRCALGVVLESLKLPVRVDLAYRCAVQAGIVALDLTAPGANLMPLHAWIGGGAAQALDVAGSHEGRWMPVSREARQAQAERYALHLGLLLVASAFETSPLIERLDLTIRFLDDDRAREGAPPSLLGTPGTPAFCSVSFLRPFAVYSEGFSLARASNPLPPYYDSNARFDVEAVNAFAAVESLPSFTMRKDLPETGEEALAGRVASALGTPDTYGLRINFDAAYRRLAEGIADKVACTESVSDAIRVVRQAQEEAAARGDERAVDGCTRVMAALAEGGVDDHDQNVIVSRFLGKDHCLTALARAKTFAENDDMTQAVAVLQEAVAEVSALEGFIDTSKEVYRTFDSYASRVVYNLAREGVLPEPSRAREDAQRVVALAPDSYYLCHLEIVRLLEHSFERSEEAVDYGRRAVTLAPTAGAGYRQLGRAYMLVGDMDNARAVLEECLRIAVQPNDIAMAYYQLAYVLWKLGRLEEGAACYVKSLATSPVMAMQSSVELHELLEESGLAMPEQENVDAELLRLGVPLAPSEVVLEALDRATVAAVEAGAFAAARNMLAIRLRYRPDDALVDVLRSLEG